MRIWSTLGAAFLVVVMIVGLGLAFSPGSSEAVPTTVPPGRPTQDVNVVNEPVVTANQGGTWNVGVTGIPAVKLDETGNTVKVDSSETSPVYVSMTNPADSPTKEPYGGQVGVFFEGGKDYSSAYIALPDEGKWLVIETVSVHFVTPYSEYIVACSLSNYESDAYLYLTPTLSTDNGEGLDWFLNATACKMYCAPGSHITLAVRRGPTSPAGTAAAAAYISGYLTDQL